MAANPANDREVYLRITRPHDKCLLCNAPLNIDGRHPSLIELSEKEEVVRKDFCPKCWQKLGESQYFSFWVTKRVNQESAEERRLAKAERNEALWRLFAALYTTSDTSAGDLAPQLFLLAHLLMKYRVLQFTGARDGVLHFAHPKLGEAFEIPDLPLDSADFAALNTELEKKAIEFVDNDGDDDESAGPREE